MNNTKRFERYLRSLDPDEQNDLLDLLLEREKPVKTELPGLITAIETLEEAEELIARQGEIVGLSTGYKAVDKMTQGMAEGDLVIVYGDTSHGKSQFTQNIAYNIAATGQPVLFVGLEMTNAQNTTRFMAIGEGHTTRDQTLLNILYPFDNDLQYSNIEPHIKQAADEGVKLVVIDQLQQLTRSIDNTTSETSMITHELKRMAVKYNLTVILISHINRSGQTSSAPTLRELKGSSSIEQDADICLAVWRDMDSRHDKRHILEVWLRKNRNRGMEYDNTELLVENGVRLREIWEIPQKTLAL